MVNCCGSAASARPAAIALQRTLAKEVRARAVGGDDFSSLATIYGEGSERHQGGDLGWREPRILRLELGGPAHSLKPGEVREVIETEDGFYLLHVAERREAALRPMSQVKGEIERQVLADKCSEAMKAWLDKLKSKAVIQRFE